VKQDILLRVENLHKYFHLRRGGGGISLSGGRHEVIRAVDRISFVLRKGEILGFVGESGCGKSTMSRLILRLIEPTGGSVFFDGTDITALDRNGLKDTRRRMQMIFQDPHGSLNPRRTVSDTLRQSLRIHRLASGEEEEDFLIRKTLEEIELKPVESFWERFPDLLSGGQRQRVGIGRVLILQPEFIVADEPISMLDVSVRIGILDLLLGIRENHRISFIYITHDLATARYICDRIAIMYLGRIVEMGPTEVILDNPLHPYTKALIAAVPVTDPTVTVENVPIRGFVPTATPSPAGFERCRFNPRCLETSGKCRGQEPDLYEVEPDHLVACLNVY
jgi:peptide/nickel transport system ATP-binding protein